MDQIKDILRQAIRYRFWILVGIAGLLPMIAYFAGAGSIQAAAAQQKGEIESVNTDVKQYVSGPVYNTQHKRVVDEETGVLTSEINDAWYELYDRQAPLLTWPEAVAEDMEAWGRQWPAGVDPAAVQLVIDSYINNYPLYVDEVYATVNPWDSVEGTGVVVTPPKELLLKPVPFDPTKPTQDLGQLWAAQERLWVQKALLEVVRKVNKNAKDWNSAVIKQINEMEVASPTSLDQISTANGETLVPPPEIVAGGGEAAVETAVAVDTSGYGAESSGYGGGYGGMEGYGMGMPKGPEIGYLSSSNEQYQVVPIMMSVLIDQNSINNLLVELANSPMSILVVDYEQSRPATRLKEPVKGQMMGGFMMGYDGYSEMGMMGGYGMNNEMMMSGYGMGMPGMEMGYGGGMMGGMGMTKKSGTDLRSRDLAKEKEEARTKSTTTVAVQIHDPYFNVVQVRIYGQARFYNAPPDEAVEESPGYGGYGGAVDEAGMIGAEDGAPADDAVPEAGLPEPSLESAPIEPADAPAPAPEVVDDPAAATPEAVMPTEPGSEPAVTPAEAPEPAAPQR